MTRNPESLPTSAFDYSLPRERIARHPAARRDESRLLVLHRGAETETETETESGLGLGSGLGSGSGLGVGSGRIEDGRFPDLVELIEPGDVLVVNETRVIPARLIGTRGGGGAAEALLLRPVSDDAREWEALVRPGARLKAGRSIRIAEDLVLEIMADGEAGVRTIRLQTSLEPREAIAKHGRVPLPPYMERAAEPEDVERYQTVYAREEGSVAAPTAGLHFTPELLAAIEAKGVGIARLLLHVGAGTFRPVETENPAEHPMHAEWYALGPGAVEAIETARAKGGKLWAVGTTVTRVLETIAADGPLRPAVGWTDLFIRPPYTFRAVDRLITNFHLPRSTLLMLVCAFGGHETVMRAYRHAVEHGYRFYSYGDAMVIV